MYIEGFISTGKLAPDPEALYRYGGGSGPIHFAGFRCHGNESCLVNCSVDFSGLAVIHCRHYEYAGVRCPSGEVEIIYCCAVHNIIVIFINPLYNYIDSNHAFSSYRM